MSQLTNELQLEIVKFVAGYLCTQNATQCVPYADSSDRNNSTERSSSSNINGYQIAIAKDALNSTSSSVVNEVKSFPSPKALFKVDCRHYPYIIPHHGFYEQQAELNLRRIIEMRMNNVVYIDEE